MPQKNKTNNNKKSLQNYRTRTQTQTYARYSVADRPEQDPPSRTRITAGGNRIPIILDTGATQHLIPIPLPLDEW